MGRDNHILQLAKGTINGQRFLVKDIERTKNAPRLELGEEGGLVNG